MSMEAYAKAKAEFDRATAERTQIIGRTHEIIKALAQSPDRFHFSNCEGGFPMEVIMNRASPSASAEQWPTAQQIQNTLVRWHNTRASTMDAWQALSTEQRSVMQPPRP